MPKHLHSMAAGILVVLVLLLYMVSFTVRFNEAAVVTTFGKAGDGAVKNADGEGAGLYWKWPYPIQDVRVFDRRVQLHETRLEQMTTRDNHTLIVTAYVAWRIGDPLAFFRSLGNVTDGQKQLEARLREANAIVSRYRFDELTSTDPQLLKLSEVEEKIKTRLQEELGAQGYGIQVETVGLKRLGLPEDVSKTVFTRMRETRERMASTARSSGDAIASKIRSEAESQARIIQAFADRRAEAIRAEGDAAAAEYYNVFEKSEDFAIFLREIEALRKTLKQNTTFLLDMETAPFDLLKPDARPMPKQDAGDKK